MSTTSDPFIPLSEPCLTGNEWEYVKQCLDTGWVSSAGSFVNDFEAHVANYVGAKHAVATMNGTAALHVALIVAGVQPGDEVLVSTLTFAASANAIRYLGAHPVLIDAEPDYWQIDSALVEQFLTENCEQRDTRLVNRSTGRRVAAIVPVHILGHPVDLDTISRTAKRFDIPVVEDAAEAMGTAYRGQPVGGSGNLVCFSFNGNKTITAGAGGMLVTDDESLAKRARHLTTQAKCDPVEYVHDEIGYNYRMSNVLAAIGLAQLESLDAVVTRKREIAGFYRETLSDDGIRWQAEADNASSTFWLATAYIDEQQTGFSAVQLRDHLTAHGVQTRRLWMPMHQNKPFRDCECLLTGVADDVSENCLSFPSSPNLTDASLERICNAVRDAAALKRAA